MSAVGIRLAANRDIPALDRIERAAGRLFREIGMAEIADDESLPEAMLAAGVAEGRLWVADAGDGPVAYLLALRLGDRAHIEQVSVDPAYARRGVGARLIAACVAWAREWGARSLTLTTFRDVPWNAPYYARLGFRIVPEDDVPQDIRSIVEEERRAGLDRWPRVVMEFANMNEATETGFTVETREVPEQCVLSTVRHVTAGELSHVLADESDRIVGLAMAHGGPVGFLFVIYHGPVDEERDGPVEVCMPIRPDVDIPEGINVRIIPGYSEAYVRVAKSGVVYPDILDAYRAVERWCEEHRGGVGGAPREVYYPGFPQAAGDEIAAEIGFPIAQ